MPSRPGTPCRAHLCAAIVRPDQRGYCDKPEHAKQRWGDGDRLPASRRNYGAAHRARRRVVFQEERFCRACGSEEDHRAVLDHIDGDNSNNQRSNLQRLCHDCHNTKTNRYDGGFGNPRRGE